MTATTSSRRRMSGGPARDGFRLLAQVPSHGGRLGLADHRLEAPAPPTPSRRSRSELVDLVELSGLRGHGGAGFPTGTKFRAVAERGRRPVVVVNGTEGEPTSAKDRLLLMLMPHLVLDGAVVAASAVGAGKIFVCVKRTSRGSLESLEHAIAERQGSDGVDIRVVAVPPRYVAGEETALVHFLNGGAAKPTMTPPRPFERGVDGRPTLVQNAETLAHVAQIATYGPSWFREAGTREEPGTTLLTVNDRVHEVGFGTSLAAVLVAAGSVEPTTAVLIGGYFGTWLPPAAIADARISNAYLRPLGAAIGCGAVFPLSTRHCGLVESARVVQWMARENAGQCGPCVNGLTGIANAFTAVVAGRAGRTALEQLHRWCGDVEGRGACRHPDGVVRFLRSAMTVFADDLADHVAGRPCRGVRETPVLPVPATGEDWR